MDEKITLRGALRSPAKTAREATERAKDVVAERVDDVMRHASAWFRAKTPATNSFEVASAVNGQMLVHVVDATNNVNNFEHDTTRWICDELRRRNVALSAESPRLPTTLKAFTEAFRSKDAWNTLLLFSHGRREKNGADYLRLADVRANWFLANGVDMGVTDKAVFLCVCEGACSDAEYVLLRDQLAMILVAPTTSLTRDEAKALFPAVLSDFVGKKGITPEEVRDAIAKHRNAANNKMTVFSAVGFAK